MDTVVENWMCAQRLTEFNSCRTELCIHADWVISDSYFSALFVFLLIKLFICLFNAVKGESILNDWITRITVPNGIIIVEGKSASFRLEKTAHRSKHTQYNYTFFRRRINRSVCVSVWSTDTFFSILIHLFHLMRLRLILYLFKIDWCLCVCVCEHFVIIYFNSHSLLTERYIQFQWISLKVRLLAFCSSWCFNVNLFNVSFSFFSPNCPSPCLSTFPYKTMLYWYSAQPHVCACVVYIFKWFV